MHYHVKVVGDSALPAGHDWVVVRDGDQSYMFVRESAARVGITIGAAPVEAIHRLVDEVVAA